MTPRYHKLGPQKQFVLSKLFCSDVPTNAKRNYENVLQYEMVFAGCKVQVIYGRVLHCPVENAPTTANGMLLFVLFLKQSRKSSIPCELFHLHELSALQAAEKLKRMWQTVTRHACQTTCKRRQSDGHMEGNCNSLEKLRSTPPPHHVQPKNSFTVPRLTRPSKKPYSRPPGNNNYTESQLYFCCMLNAL